MVCSSQDREFTIEDYFDIVFPDSTAGRGYLCMIYQCFLDDSKDRDQTKLMVSAGLFGTKEQWGSLRVGWQKILDKHGLKYFKSSEYYNLSGQFAKFHGDEYPRPKGREAAQLIRAELQSVIHQNQGIRAMGISIPLESYYGVYEQRPEAKGVIPADPYQAALVSVIYETAKVIKARPGRNMVAFVHDEDDRFPVLYSAYLKFKGANPDIAKYIGGFGPLDDKEHPPLQAADMLANYTLQLGLDGLKNGDMKADPKEMRSSIKTLGYWSEHYLLSVLKQNLITQGKPLPLDLDTEQYG